MDLNFKGSFFNSIKKRYNNNINTVINNNFRNNNTKKKVYEPKILSSINNRI